MPFLLSSFRSDIYLSLGACWLSLVRRWCVSLLPEICYFTLRDALRIRLTLSFGLPYVADPSPRFFFLYFVFMTVLNTAQNADIFEPVRGLSFGRVHRYFSRLHGIVLMTMLMMMMMTMISLMWMTVDYYSCVYVVRAMPGLNCLCIGRVQSNLFSRSRWPCGVRIQLPAVVKSVDNLVVPCSAGK